MMNTSMAA